MLDQLSDQMLKEEWSHVSTSRARDGPIIITE